MTRHDPAAMAGPHPRESSQSTDSERRYTETWYRSQADRALDRIGETLAHLAAQVVDHELRLDRLERIVYADAGPNPVVVGRGTAEAAQGLASTFGSAGMALSWLERVRDNLTGSGAA